MDHSLSLLSSFLTGVPNYIWGLLIIIVLGIQLNLFNVGELRGTYDIRLVPDLNAEFVLSVFKHAALPIATYVIATLGGWMLNMKSSTMGVLNEDYVNVAEARGLKDKRIITSYVGRNASLPLFTQLTIAVGFVLGSGVVIEEIFRLLGHRTLPLSSHHGARLHLDARGFPHSHDGRGLLQSLRRFNLRSAGSARPHIR